MTGRILCLQRSSVGYRGIVSCIAPMVSLLASCLAILLNKPIKKIQGVRSSRDNTEHNPASLYTESLDLVSTHAAASSISSFRCAGLVRL